MQTVENPSAIPQNPSEPRIILHKPLMQEAGVHGYSAMLKMYNKPFMPYLPKHFPATSAIYRMNPEYSRWEIEQLAQCIGKGLVAMAATGDGFQLTTDGRYYMAQDLKHKAGYEQRYKEALVKNGYVRYGDWDSDEPQPFDLSEF